MADLRKIDGSVLDTEKLGRNERIAGILEKLTEDNDAGKLSALAVIFLNHAQEYDAFWAYPDDVAKYPWLFVVLGAIETLKAKMIGEPRTPPAGPA
jgi:hypothetical protein